MTYPRMSKHTAVVLGLVKADPPLHVLLLLFVYAIILRLRQWLLQSR